MTPHDLKSLAQLLLTPTQYALGETEWQKGLQALLVNYVGHKNQASAALMLDHLMGTGPHTDTVAQAQIPRQALEATREAARLAFLKVSDTQMPQKAFTTIV